MDKINVFNLSRGLSDDAFDRSSIVAGNLEARLRHNGIYSVTTGAVGSGSLKDLSFFWANTAQGATKATFVGLPSQNQNTYASIRRMSDLQYGVNSVCAVTTNNKIPWYAKAYPPRG